MGVYFYSTSKIAYCCKSSKQLTAASSLFSKRKKNSAKGFSLLSWYAL